MDSPMAGTLSFQKNLEGICEEMMIPKDWDCSLVGHSFEIMV